MTNKKKIVKALPVVLFYVGLAGIFVSEALLAKDTLKAKDILDKYPIEVVDEEKPRPYTDNANACEVILCSDKPTYVKEIIKATWKCFIPSAVSTTLTLTALLTSRHLTKKEITLLTTAAASGASLVQKYRKEILDRTDTETLRNIDSAVAKATMKETNPVCITTSHLMSGECFNTNEDGEFLFFDPLTKMKFRTTKLAADSARYYLNRNFSLGGCVGLEMFYGFLGLNLPEEYRFMQWDMDEMSEGGWTPWIDIDFVHSTTCDPETGEDYYIIEYDYQPGELEDGPYEYPFGNPLISEGSVAI